MGILSCIFPISRTLRLMTCHQEMRKAGLRGIRSLLYFAPSMSELTTYNRYFFTCVLILYWQWLTLECHQEMCVVCLSTRCLVERCIMSSSWLQWQRGHVGLVTLGWSELWAELTVSIDTGLNDRREKWVTKFKKNCFVGCIRRSIEQTTSS